MYARSLRSFLNGQWLLMQWLVPIEEMLGVGVDVHLVHLAGGGLELAGVYSPQCSTTESYIPAAERSAALLLFRMNSAWSLRSLIRR
jgi:hypothetical protein